MLKELSNINDERNRTAAGEQTGAGLKDRIGEQQGET